jgi:competence protein ComEC
MLSRKINVKNKIFITLIIIAAVFSATVSLTGNWIKIYDFFGLGGGVTFVTSEGVSVHFINVGQGESVLIITPENNILIDGGERVYYTVVLNYLRAQDVNRLDFIIATHPHSDHIGGMGYIINELDVRRIIKPDIKEELVPVTSSYLRLIDSIEKNDVEVIWAAAGMVFCLENNSQIEILAPLQDYEKVNDYSVVTRFSHYDNSFLFTGDIESSAENDITDSRFNINADVLQVAHHGSRTSSTAKFLNAVGGSYAVISVGSPNLYNHPNDDVINRLLNRNYEILRTDVHGNIVFDITSSGFTVHVQNNCGSFTNTSPNMSTIPAT